MNILFISYGLFPCKIGGVEIFNYHLIESLNNKNQNTYLITSCNKETGLKSKVYVIKKIKYIPNKILTPLISFLIILKLRKKIDLIHAPYTGSSWIYGFFLPLTKKIFKIPYILMIHGGGMHKYGITAIRRLLFRNSSCLIGVSEKIKNEYEKRTNKKVILIKNLIPHQLNNKSKYKLKKQYKYENEILFLFVGSIKKIKGIEVLVEAFIRLGIEFIKKNKLRLLIIGQGPLSNRLLKVIKDYGFDCYINLIGFVDENKKYEYLKMSDVFIIPSYFEAQSLSLFDAMASECAIIGSNTTGINNIIIDRVNGLLFSIKDIDDLKKQMIMLVKNKELRLVLSKKAKEYHKKFCDYNKWLENILNIYTITIGTN